MSGTFRADENDDENFELAADGRTKILRDRAA